MLRYCIFASLVASLLGSISVAQIPSIPQPSVPQPAAMPQPGQIPSGGDFPGNPGPQVSPGDGGQQGPQNGFQNASFIGTWCAQGDPTKHTSVSFNGAFYNLTNENGDTSTGNLQGQNQIQAPGWQFVTGTLTQNGRQIQWSNGTFWARCPSPGGRGKFNLNGNWYPNGNRSLQCSIQQHRGNLTLQNETGQRATGSLSSNRRISTNWQGTKITGTLTSDGNRINWSNGTYWIRYRLFTQ